MHVRLCDVLDYNRDVEVPSSDGLVVRRGYEPPIIVHKRDCVHRPEMLVVFLRDLPRVHIVLMNTSSGTSADVNYCTRMCPHLDDLLVGHTRQENVLLVFVRMESHDVRDFSIAEPLQASTGLGVPELHLSVISTGQKLAAVV